MGQGFNAATPVEVIKERLAIRQDGGVGRHDDRPGALAHQPAGYRGADGKLMVSLVAKAGPDEFPCCALRGAWREANGREDR